jgi:hypothetical protein
VRHHTYISKFEWQRQLFDLELEELILVIKEQECEGSEMVMMVKLDYPRPRKWEELTRFEQWFWKT